MLKKNQQTSGDALSLGKKRARAEEAVVSLREMRVLWGKPFRWRVISEGVCLDVSV